MIILLQPYLGKGYNVEWHLVQQSITNPAMKQMYVEQ